jgi:vacuolar-type H+-ATPase catalytic subunit A/Vma1
MSKQDIKIVQEFNSWRKGGGEMSCDEGYPKRLGEALDEVVKSAERYELVRTLNVTEFKNCSLTICKDSGQFDSLIDALIKAR